MPTTTAPRLTPRQRLTRGLAHTATGPVDLTRGAVGLGVQSVRAGAVRLRRGYRDSRLAQEIAEIPELLAHEVAALPELLAHEVTALPEALRNTRRSSGRRRWKVAAAVAAALLAAGAAVTVVVRRVGPPQEAPLRPPSVEVQPRP